MFIPKGNNIHVYDVNSLYPFVILNYKYLIGKSIYFIGDILNSIAVGTNAFGFFYCRIVAPINLLHPILQTHVKINNSIRTISPLGIFEGMFFSEEL